MVRGMAAIAERDQVCRIVGPTGGTRNQMMNVGFTLCTWFTTSPASVGVASENDGANGAPSLEVCLVRRKRHGLQLRIHGYWSECPVE